MDNQNNINEVPNQTPVEPVKPAAPSLMRESIDENGNEQYALNNQGPDMADKAINAVEGIMNTKDHKSEFDSEEVKNYKTLAILSYIPIVAIIFAIMGKHKESKYLKFHVNQGLVLAILLVIVSIISTVLGIVFAFEAMIKNNIPIWVSFVSYFLYCVCFIAMMYGIINTANNNSRDIPLIGKIRILK